MLNGKAGFLFKVDSVKHLKKKILYVAKRKNSKILKKKIKNGFYSLKRFSFDKNINLYLKEIKKYL